jgi:hypothetical protein
MEMLKKIVDFLTAHPHTDAILIGLGSSATFISMTIFSVVHNPSSWHPESFGVGFGSLATGLGALFFLKKSSLGNQ